MKIIIDGREIEADSGQSILEAAKNAGIEIPALCYHPDLSVKANCRMCLVEIENQRAPLPACQTKISEGMKIITNSPKIRNLRKINLELIFSQHKEECNDCVWLGTCQLLKLAKEYEVEITRFADRKSGRPVYKIGPIEFDQTKCIDCRNCLEICQKQSGGFLELTGRGYEIGITPSADTQKDCLYCGQCIVHCPVGAIEAEGEFEEIEKPLLDAAKTVVVQFAPSIRSSIGEMFDLPPGAIMEGQLVAGLKQLGFKKVFDTAVSADFTTIEEANELVERLKNNGVLPMFTSCCPAWVRYVEFFRPDLIPNLTTARSPQSMFGGLIKTFWAQKQNLKPSDIVVVSIMPCTAKKYDVVKEDNYIDGSKRIDYVLTTRELGRLLAKHNIDLKNLAPLPADQPFSEYSGAGVIYGAAGGVMESAIRTACWQITGKNPQQIEYQAVRGIVGLKTAEIAFGDLKIKIAAANGMENAREVLAILDKNPKSFDYIEIMACPGGCIGGGGQPLPVSDEIRRQRAAALYQIDCAKTIRFAHDNPAVINIYEEFFGKDKEKIHKILHTNYLPKSKTAIQQIR